jgi:hypothetical protein
MINNVALPNVQNKAETGLIKAHEGGGSAVARVPFSGRRAIGIK